MATSRLNLTNVKAAMPEKKDWYLWDDKMAGFGLKVTPKGGKVFIYQYRMGGRGTKVRRYTIGKFGKVTPDAARDIAEGLGRKIAEGVDPQRQKIENARRQVDLAFDTCIEGFRNDCLKKGMEGDTQVCVLAARDARASDTQGQGSVRRHAQRHEGHT